MSFSDLLCFIALLLGFLFRFRSDKTLIIIALMHKMSWKKVETDHQHRVSQGNKMSAFDLFNTIPMTTCHLLN